jgi:hypothetical protein
VYTDIHNPLHRVVRVSEWLAAAEQGLEKVRELRFMNLKVFATK